MPLGFGRSLLSKTAITATYNTDFLVIAGGASGGVWIG